MTEAQTWLEYLDPESMLIDLGDDASPRKLRLFAVECCRRIQAFLSDSRSLHTLEVAERFADGLADEGELSLAASDAYEAVDQLPWLNERDCRSLLSLAAGAAWELVSERADFVARKVSDYSAHCFGEHQTQGLEGEAYQIAKLDRRLDEQEKQCHLLREIFGNPFRPVSFDPDWRSSTVLTLAQHIYDSRDFSPMPILADALQDAGCDNEDILAHCRDANATHVRGCWVVDLVLGKS